MLDDVGDEAEAVAHVAQRDDDRGPGVGGEDQAHGILLAADAERVQSRASPAWTYSDGLTSSMWAPRISSLPGLQVVRVVLHEARAAREARAHHGGGAHEHRGLPVALGAEAVAVGHEALHGEPGQLPQRRRGPRTRGERGEAAGLEEVPQAELDRAP